MKRHRSKPAIEGSLQTIQRQLIVTGDLSREVGGELTKKIPRGLRTRRSLGRLAGNPVKFVAAEHESFGVIFEQINPFRSDYPVADDWSDGGIKK